MSNNTKILIKLIISSIYNYMIGCSSCLFWLLTCILWISWSLFICSPVEGHFRDFQLIVIISRSTINIFCIYPLVCKLYQEFFLAVFQSAEMLYHGEYESLVLKDNAELSSKGTLSLSISLSSVWKTLLIRILANSWYSSQTSQYSPLRSI